MKIFEGVFQKNHRTILEMLKPDWLSAIQNPPIYYTDDRLWSSACFFSWLSAIVQFLFILIMQIF